MRGWEVALCEAPRDESASGAARGSSARSSVDARADPDADDDASRGGPPPAVGRPPPRSLGGRARPRHRRIVGRGDLDRVAAAGEAGQGNVPIARPSSSSAPPKLTSARGGAGQAGRWRAPPALGARVQGSSPRSARRPRAETQGSRAPGQGDGSPRPRCGRGSNIRMKSSWRRTEQWDGERAVSLAGAADGRGPLAKALGDGGKPGHRPVPAALAAVDRRKRLNAVTGDPWRSSTSAAQSRPRGSGRRRLGHRHQLVVEAQSHHGVVARCTTAGESRSILHSTSAPLSDAGVLGQELIARWHRAPKHSEVGPQRPDALAYAVDELYERLGRAAMRRADGSTIARVTSGDAAAVGAPARDQPAHRVADEHTARRLSFAESRQR